MSRRGWKALLLLPIVLLCLGSECDLAEPEDNFVTVHVSARAFIEIQIPGPALTPTQQPWVGAQVQLEVIKAGGEREVLAGPTAGDGSLGPVTATFKVYREQPVEAKARILGGPLPPEFGDDLWDPLTFRIWGQQETLPWETILHLMGKEYYWYPDVSLWTARM